MTVASPPSSLPRFDRYESLFRIAAGGMAEVFAARIRGEGGFEKLVAIKRMLPHLVDDEAFVNMFLDEARLAVQVASPHVVQTLDLGRADDGALKEAFFLQTKEEDHDPYESSQFTLLIANATGIYGVYSYREVFELKEFWSIGSGRSFALGAMHAVYARARNARDVAQAGLAAGCEFDRSTAAPLDIVTLKLKAGA